MNTARRQPKQQRSKERVDRILAAATELITESGIEALSMRAVSERSGVAVGTVYRYFSDRDELASAFLLKQTERSEAAIAEAVFGLETVSIRSLVEVIMRAYLEHHSSQPEIAAIWFSTQKPAIVSDHLLEQDRKLARWIYSVGLAADFFKPETPDYGYELIVMYGDRTFDYIFNSGLSSSQQREIVEYYIDMIATWLEKSFATKRGLEGIPASEFQPLLVEVMSRDWARAAA